MNGKLVSALSTPMKHISDVHKCFSFCESEDDIDEVIDMIPYKFGNFLVEISSNGESFVVVNSFVEYGEPQIEEKEYEFYKEK